MRYIISNISARGLPLYLYRLVTLNLIIILCILFMPGDVLGLQTNEVAIIANQSVQESIEIAGYYCQKRKINPDRIIAIEMPQSERISWQSYQEMAQILRKRLQTDQMTGVKCLITTWGVPLRINGFQPQDQDLEKLKLIDRLIQIHFGELDEMIDEFKSINPIATIIKPKDANTFQMPTYWLKRDQTAQEMYKNADDAMWAARNLVKNMVNKDVAIKKKEDFETLFQDYIGLEGQLSTVASLIKQQPDREDSALFKQEYEKGMIELKKLAAEASAIRSLPFNTETWTRRYELIRKAAGLKGVCRILIADRKGIGDEDSESALDSELTLVLWEHYSPSGQIPNLLNPKYNPQNDTPAHLVQQPVLMVSRLDGPTPDIARGLVDKAIEAENTILQGQVYLDARNIKNDIDTFGSYGYFDEKIRITADILQKQTSLKVHLDNQPALFGPGQCPDTLLYCGWYSLRKYIDSFTFAPGAIGYHIASFEAETLRHHDPDTGQWCKCLLENGMTATLGAVAEPYLHTFPPPDAFFQDLVRGDDTLAEVYFRHLPFNSWRIILIGDPLFRPRYPIHSQDN